MSAKLLGQVLDADMGSHVRKWVLAKLCDAAEPDGSSIYPGKEAIAKVANCVERTVQRELSTLESSGLLILVEEARGHRPTEYRLDLDVFARVLSEGFVAVLDQKLAAGEHAVEGRHPVSPESAVREDTQASPLPEGESAPRGDTLSPLNSGTRGDKIEGQGRQNQAPGETSVRASLCDPSDPLDPLRERARKPAGDNPETAAAFQKLLSDYPGVNVPGRCFPKWQRLSDDERKQAQTNLPAYLAAQHNLGRKHHHSLETYLRDKLFNQVEPASDGAGYDIPNRSRDWWIFFHNRRVAKGVDSKTGRTFRDLAHNMLTMWAKGQNRGPPRVPALPSETERQRFVQIERGSPEFAAWARHLRDEGFQIDDDNVCGAWIWVPSEWPPGWVHDPPADHDRERESERMEGEGMQR